ncbi:MAG TPA: hypothetical protein PLU52_11290 [Opitutaceae bacterium]|nr:hypothetical protein [Opitutaceae bacterium]HND62234.1 hypothetical protein [Opitutaceae bacterium]
MKPFLHGKKSLNVPSLRQVAAPPQAHKHVGLVPHAKTGSSADLAAAPSVEVIKEGDKVARLIVTCSCGEKIEIDCIYPVGA